MTNSLCRVVCLAECTIRAPLPTLQDTYTKRVRTRAEKIMQDPTYTNTRLFTLLKSCRRLCNLKAKIERLKEGFFP